jgi:hypothetical protein
VALEQIILFLENAKNYFSQRKNPFLKKNEKHLKTFHNSLLSKWSAC